MQSRTILITGCSSGIGECVAHGLQKRGHRVFASARQLADVQRLRDSDLWCGQLDLTRPESITATLEQVLQETGGTLDALFNNGAYGQPGAVEDLTTDTLRRQFETNLFGWHELTRQVIPVMRRQGHGRIIQNSSVLGFAAMPMRGAYNASKYALEGLSDTLRLELHGSGIHVCLIEPGPIASRFRDNAYRAWKTYVDPADSHFRDHYRKLEERLLKQGPTAPFTQPPEAVLKRVAHALESRRPRPRYYVTLPTYLFGYLKRLLPTRALDALLRRV